MTDDSKLTVYFDGACPLCAREIDFYRRRPGSDAVCWVDLSDIQADEAAPGLSRDDALTRFHVQTPDGRFESGGAAFSRLWSQLPGFRALGRMTRPRPIAWLLERGYRLFLRFRPALQRFARQRESQRPS